MPPTPLAAMPSAVLCTQYDPLNDNALDLVQRDFVGPPVIKLGRAGGGMVGHLRCFFQLAVLTLACRTRRLTR